MPLAASGAAAWLIAVAQDIRRGRRPILAIAGIAGIAAMGIAIGAARGCLGPQVAGSSRYVYCVALLAVPGLVDAVAGRSLRMPRHVARLGLAIAVLVAVGLNVSALAGGHAVLRRSSDIVRSAIALVRSDPTCDTNPVATDALTSDLAILPDRGRLLELIDRYGDPGGWSWFPLADVRVPEDVRAEVRSRACDAALSVDRRAP